MRRNGFALFSAVGLAAVLSAMPVVAQASPATTRVTCGQTLTASVRLANNLVGCPGDGLVVGAAGITIDLAGHSITGRNAPGSEGVVDNGHRGVRIKNGAITHFFLTGIGLRDAPYSSVTKLTIRRIGAGGGQNDTSSGILVKNSPHTSVAANTVVNDVSAFQSDGVDVLSSAGTVADANRLTDNAWDGMVVIDSPHTSVVGNVLDGNQNEGIELNAGSDGSVLIGNRARHNVSSGLVVGAVSGVRVAGNVLVGNGDSGVFMFDLHDSWVIGNLASGNGVGIDLEGGQAGSTGNRVADNRSVFNTAGIVVADGADHNLVLANVANSNRGGPDDGGGIIVAAARANILRANVANGNRDVGIGVFADQPGDTTGNLLRANVADYNRDHGISVVNGNVDGGHNRAYGNTPKPNCLGIFCT